MKEDNIDRTQQIQDLTNARNRKIMAQDDAYSDQYSQAIRMGDYATANKVLALQNQYRQSVGYEDAMKSVEAQELEQIDIDYKSAWIATVNDIGKLMVETTGLLINFDYQPLEDVNLIRAQAQAKSNAEEWANSRGMYYSSQTQYAIAKACAELVPVYEQMAKEEILQNLSSLQSTATFLMNAEKFQYDIWYNQVKLKYEALEEERAKINQAWKEVEMQGYVGNKQSLILGIQAGTPSASAKQDMIELENQKASEERSLTQARKLGEIENDLYIQRLEDEIKVKQKYGVTSGNGTTKLTSNIVSAVESLYRTGASQETIDTYLDNSGLSEFDKATVKVQAIGNVTKNLSDTEKKENKDLETKLEKLKNISSTELDEVKNMDYLQTLDNTTKNEKIRLVASKIDDLAKLNEDEKLTSTMVVAEINKLVSSDKFNDTDIATIIGDIANWKIDEKLNEAYLKFGTDSEKTNAGIEEALNTADTFVSDILATNYKYKENIGAEIYKDIMNKIKTTAEFETENINEIDNPLAFGINAGIGFINDNLLNSSIEEMQKKAIDNVAEHVNKKWSNRSEMTKLVSDYAKSINPVLTKDVPDYRNTSTNNITTEIGPIYNPNKLDLEYIERNKGQLAETLYENQLKNK
jgi:hypothetical protein